MIPGVGRYSMLITPRAGSLFHAVFQPGTPQIVRRPMQQFGNLAVDLGHNSVPQINLRVAALTGNRGRPARVLAGRSVVAWRFHALAGSVMR